MVRLTDDVLGAVDGAKRHREAVGTDGGERRDVVRHPASGQERTAFGVDLRQDSGVVHPARRFVSVAE